MKKYITKQSNIKGAGKGLFTKDFFKKGEVIGLAHVDDQPASEIGRNHNHNEENPTAYSKKIDNKRFIYASKNLKPGEEITTNYRMQPELEQPEDFMRKGGSVLRLPNKKNSKGYSRSLSATNKLFTQNFLFEKPKSRKNKVFDPNSKYYAEGGESGCPEGYAYNPKTGKCIEWTPTIYKSTAEPTSYNPVADVIYMNPNDRPEGMSDKEYQQMYQDQLEHEQLHRFQWINGELKGYSGTPLRMPSPVDNEEHDGEHYYNRRSEEADYLQNYWKKDHPAEAEFIPDSLIYDKETNPAMYELPWTVEGEAREYEYNTRDGMPSLFPKKQNGGNKDAMNGMMKARLAYANEFGNPAAKRMINIPDNPYQFDNGDIGTHYMASYDNYAVPQIQDENGVLVLGDYGPESNEAIRFDSDEDANYFAENYKDVSPGFIEADLDEDEIEEYRKGGYIVEEIDNYQNGGVYTVKGSKGAYKKINGKWQVDWNRSGKYQPLSKGDVKARTAVLDKMAKPVDNDISKISSNSSDNTRVNNIYQKPLDWSFDPKYKNNTQAFVKKSLEEKEKAIQKEKEDNKIKKGLANNEGIKETVGQYNRRKEKYDDLDFLGKMIENDPADNYKPQPIGRSPFEDSPMTGIGGAPKMILQAGKWLKPLWTGTKTVVKKTPQGVKYIKNATQPFRQATVSALKAPLPLGRRITNATGGKLNLGNSVAAYFGADALYNQGDSNSDVVKSQSNFINNPSWNTLGDAAFETGVNSLGFSGLGLGKQVIKPVYNASKKLINNTYKINPWAFKTNPEAYYRGIGKSGLDDILESKIIRSKKQHAYPKPYFSKGVIGDHYAKGYFAELVNEPMKGVGSFPEGSLIQTPVNTISVNNPNLKLYKKHWLKGYKEVPKQYINGGSTNDYVELDLTPEEIQVYKNGGYIVEEINTYQKGGVNKKGKSYDYTRDPTYTERFKRFFGMEDVDDIAYEKVDDKNIKKYKQTTKPIEKNIRKIPTIETKSNFELDLKNRLQNISKENILKEKNISKVEPIKNSLQITGNNNSNIKNKIVKPEDSFFESTYKEIKSFDNWLDNQKKLFNNGLNRKLQTWGIVETKDKKVIESPEPINVKDYYKNPTLSQTILNVNDQPNRQFKQQTVPTSNLVLGSRNRGQYQDIESDGLEFTTFHPFINGANIKPYNKKTNVNGINDDNSVFALDNKGVLHTGIYKNLKNNKDWKFSKTFMNKIVSIDDISLDGARSGNPKFWQPQITILENNKLKKGALNILTKKGKAEEDYYGSILGGRVVFVNPLTKEQTLVSGSVSHIKKEFKRLKGDSKYLEAWSLDNGTYARGLSYKDGKLTKQRLIDYDAENTSGGNGLYIKKYNVPVNKFKETYVYDMPNVRTKKDDSYKAGHKLKNEIKNFVLHHTAYDNPITNEAEVKKQFMTPGQNSSHVVIEEDGSRTIYASPEQVSFHAGKSKWNGREDVNDFSIGVEFQGDTQKKPLTDQQVISFVEYYAPIAKKYNLNLKSIITHEQIRNAYIKKHANEKGLETKPDITYNQYKRILNYMKAKGIN